MTLERSDSVTAATAILESWETLWVFCCAAAEKLRDNGGEVSVALDRLLAVHRGLGESAGSQAERSGLTPLVS